MKTIEEIKIELTLKLLRGEFEPYRDIKNLPFDNDLRTFVCGISSYSAYAYAENVDKEPHNETRTASCKMPLHAYLYALNIDKKPHNETRTAACKEPYYGYRYAVEIDEKPLDETRNSAYKDGFCKYQYRDKFGE